MAKQLKKEGLRHLVIEGRGYEFEAIGFGFNIGGMFRVIVCDTCNNEIHSDDVCYYIPVLNRVFCNKCFDEWVKDAEYYQEDAAYEKRYFDMTKAALKEEELWENT